MSWYLDVLCYDIHYNIYLVGYSHTNPGQSCSDLDGVEDIYTEDQCRLAATYVTSSSLKPNGQYGGEVEKEKEPRWCYLSGDDIYWNKNSKGQPNIKSLSICKSKDSGECTSNVS